MSLRELLGQRLRPVYLFANQFTRLRDHRRPSDGERTDHSIVSVIQND
jgi:hypothetical protein